MKRNKKRGGKARMGHAYRARGQARTIPARPAALPKAPEEVSRPPELLAKPMESAKLPDLAARPIAEVRTIAGMASRPSELLAKPPFEAARRVEDRPRAPAPTAPVSTRKGTAIGVAVFVLGTALTFGVMRRCASEWAPAGEVDASTVEAPPASSGEFASVEG